MAISRNDVRNMLWLLSAQAIAALIGVFAFARIGGQLQVGELGRYGFAVTSTVSFGLLAELGVRYVAMREIALAPELTETIYRHSSLLRWMLSALSLSLLVAIAAVGPWHTELGLLTLATLVAVTQFGSDPATWVFFGRNRVDIGAIILIVDRVLYLIAINVAANLFHSARSLILAALAANLLRMALSAYWVRRHLLLSPVRTWDRRLFQRLVTSGIMLGIAIIVFVTYSSVPTILVRTFSTPEDLGYFAVSFGVATILLVIPTSLTMAIFPTIASQFTQGDAQRRHLYELVFRLNLIIAVPIAVGLIAIPEQVVSVWIGWRYGIAAENLRIFAIAMIASALSFMYRLLFFALDRPQAEAVTSGVGIVLLVAAGIPMCQRFGGFGVALAFLCVEFGISSIKALMVGPLLGRPPVGRYVLGTIIASSVPGSILLVDSLPLLIRGGGYLGGVLILTLLLRLIPADFVELAKNMLAKWGIATDR